MAESEQIVKDESIPFYPDHVGTEFRVVIGITVIAFIFGAIALIAPVGLGDPADPMNTPAHAKPEWYFLALYQLLKYIPKTAGAVLPVLAVILITLWPFLDRKPDKSRKIYKIRFVVVTIGLVLLVAMTILGEAS
jgi:quinol-cytochrome oxidoreductase complex cytochrome b subunit